MRITKRQLRRIIKEERAKLLSENNPSANAERTLGLYAPTAVIDRLNTSIADLLEQIEMEAIQDGLESQEAEEMAADAVLMAVSDALGAAGMFSHSQALIYALAKK